MRSLKINTSCKFTPPSLSTKGGGYSFSAFEKKSYHWPICKHSNFQGQSFKIENSNVNPFCHFAPSQHQWGGYLFWDIYKKNLRNVKFTCIQYKMNLAYNQRIGKINPIRHFNPPPNTQGGGNVFFGYTAKILIISQFACRQIFRALASISRIVKINPTCHFSPPSTKRGGYLFSSFQSKKVLFCLICMLANFQSSSFKMEDLKN